MIPIKSAAAVALASASAALAACTCGYRDPATQALWTDSIITYFNETSAPQAVVLDPASSPDRYGRGSAGSTGDGQQPWAASQETDAWEDDFGATWRAAVSYNNTFFPQDASTTGLAMEVAPADTVNRISYGAQLVSRRRDMLYGSFRAYVQPSTPASGGTEFDMTVGYNQSEIVQTSLYSSDAYNESTLQWSFSARGQDADPVVYNLTSLDVSGTGSGNPYGFHEYRADWLPDSLAFSNDGTNTTSNSYRVTKSDSLNLPSVGSPWAFKHWSNGSPTKSEGPPLHHAAVAHVLYVRLFFNSSLPERQQAFERECAGGAAAPVCSTDDLTLRDVTPFSLAATQHLTPPKIHRPTPLYAIIVDSVVGGIFVLLVLHALAKRAVRARNEKKEFYAKYNAERDNAEQYYAENDHAGSIYGSALASARPSTDTLTSMADVVQIAESRYYDEAVAKWDDPALLLAESDDSDDEDDSDAETKYAFDDPFSEAPAEPKTLPSHDFAAGYVPPVLRSASAHTSLPASNTGSDHSSGSGKWVGQDDADAVFTPPSPAFLRDVSSRKNSYSQLLTPREEAHLSHRSDSSAPPTSADDGFGAPPSWPRDLTLGHNNVESGSQYSPPPSTPPAHSQAHAQQYNEHAQRLQQRAWRPRIAEWAPDAATSNDDGKGGKLAQAPQEVVEQNKKEAATAPNPVTQPASFLARIKQRIFVGKADAKFTASGAARVNYLDGLRGFACFLVSFHHYCLIFYYGFTTPDVPVHYSWEKIIYRTLGPVICNGWLNVGIFFMLASRVIANRYLVKGQLSDLAQQVLTRVPRLAITVTGAIVINYMLIEVDAYYWVPRLASRTYSVWSYWEDYHVGGLGEFIDDWLELFWLQPPGISPFVTHYATGILWTLPLIIQYSWTVYLCALITREIKNPWKRYGFYSTCIFLSWWAGRYDYYFLTGLMIADLDNRLKYRKLSEKGFRLGKLHFTLEPLAWALFALGAALTWLTYNSVINVPDNEFGIHPNFPTAQPNKWVDSDMQYYDPEVMTWIWVTSFFLLCDLSPTVSRFFQLRHWSVLGRNAFSLYLLHGVVFWTAGASATLHMLRAGIPYWASQIINLVLCYTLLLLLCEVFTRTFDRWGVTGSRAIWRLTSGGLGRRV